MSRTPRVFLFVFGSAAVMACGGDPAEFRPAKDATSHAAVRDAYRIQQAPPECTPIGSVHATDEDSNPIEAIAATAARHGGTHYVVRDDKTDVTSYTITPGFVTSKITPDKTRTVWAQVYRCPT